MHSHSSFSIHCAQAEFLDTGATDVNGVDYTKAIYVLQSNLCKDKINEALTDFLRKGHEREAMQLKEMEDVLKICVKRSEGDSELYRKHVLQYVPFLPIERSDHAFIHSSNR